MIRKTKSRKRGKSDKDRLYWIMLLLVVIGLLLSIVSVINHFANKSIMCHKTSSINCDIVNNSVYAYFLGVYVGVWGIISFAVALLLLLLKSQIKNILYLNQRDFAGYLLLLFGVMLAFSLYLTFTEQFIIHKYCFVCLLTFFTLILLFTSSLQWFARSKMRIK